MSDLISRSAAKDEILSWAVVINKPHLLSKDDTLHVLDTLPAVDAVVPVRCKDCKHMFVPVPGIRYCTVWNNPNGMGDDGFCNYGERRD